MNEFNFKSAICTSIDQSRRLLALGLKKTTADCRWTGVVKDSRGKDIPKNEQMWFLQLSESENYQTCGFSRTEFLPAWSLHRLLCFLPKHIQVYDEVWKFKRNLYFSIDEDFNIRYEENIDEPCFDKIFWAYDIYKNCVEAIEWLIKEGYFSKEYLEE